jgi:probable DNA repair protein
MPRMPAAPIGKRELFDRLAEGHAAQITVVTPNRRLAQELAREFDEEQVAQGLAVWETADILPFAAFTERLYEDALYSGTGLEPPQLLTPAQEERLWEEVISRSRRGEDLLVAAQAAAQCREAWRLKHAWRIGAGSGSEDAAAFDEWSRAYARHTARERLTDGARLADDAAALLKEGALRKPKLLAAYAFEILPPQTREFLDACAALGIEVRACGPGRRQAKPLRVAFASAREELEAAAKWARARLEGSARRIGVVVPELERRRKEVVRVFSRVMQPGYNLPGAVRRPMPFNVSLGAPLAECPLVHAALGVLELAAGEVDFALASRLLRSPFIGGAERERSRRARLDVELRRRLPARLTLARLVASVAGCVILRERLEALVACARANLAGRQSPHAWARHFSALLEAAGFPGERALDSEEFQARAKFHEALGEFARLARIAPALACDEALARLRRLCAETLFEPASGESPIQVLGILESAGLEFDHLWVCGLSEDAWPLAVRPNPFLPVALQKKAGVPEASAETSLALDRRITAGWMGAAGEVVLSHPLREEDRELLPSPLIAPVPEGKVEMPAYRRYRDLLFAARALESAPDGRAPPLAAKAVRGGTRVLADQAACPFRAFARHRLGAEGLESPAPGLDAVGRGKLLHELMRNLWSALKTSTALRAVSPEVIEQAAADAVARLGIEGRFAELERERLVRLAREWLEVERGRPAFEVVALEERRRLAVAGLEISGRIDRLDRLAAGGYALIDYKSGRASPKEWLGERPDDPQLPLYALNAGEDIATVAFARLKTGDMKFMGLSRAAHLVPGVKPALDWNALLAGWRKELEALGEGFAAGDARVDPKNLLQTCRECDLQPLCRVFERVNALAEGREAAEAEAE